MCLCVMMCLREKTIKLKKENEMLWMNDVRKEDNNLQ